MRNHHKGIIPTSGIREGDIIEFAGRHSLTRRPHQQAQGYVHHIIYNPQQNNEIVGFTVFELASIEEAKKTDRKYTVLDLDEAGETHGLKGERPWAAIIHPIRLSNDGASFGRDGDFTQRLGNIEHTRAQEKLQDMVQSIGEENMYFGREGFRYASSNQKVWGLYEGKELNRVDPEFIERQEKTGRRKGKAANKKGGRVLDILLTDAAITLDMDRALIGLFERPAGDLKPISGLRELWEMADKPAELLQKYIPEGVVLREDIAFNKLEDELFPAVFNGLRQPRANAPDTIKPITSLQEAYDLVRGRPEDLQHYSYLGPKNREIAIDEITRLHAAREKIPAFSLPAVVKSVKSAWSSLIIAYDKSLRPETQRDVPEKFKRADGTYAWFTRDYAP